MPRSASRRVTAAGTVEPPRPTVLKCDRCSSVQSGWSSRLVTKYGGPPPIDRPSDSISVSTLPGSQTSARSIGAPSRTGIRNAPSMPMKCPTGVAVSCRPRSVG